jgi:hypothetical protein
MTELLPPDAVDAATTIAAIAQRYTHAEISAMMISFGDRILNGDDSAYQEMADFNAMLARCPEFAEENHDPSY